MSTKPPSYRLHKSSGQAVVSFGRENIYLGKYDTAESWSKYASTIAEWKAAGCRRVKKGSVTTVSRLTVAFAEHAARHYVKRGKPTSHLAISERICGELSALYGGSPVAEFGAAQFKALRQTWIDREGGPLCRSTINQYAAFAREIFRWGVEEGLVPALVLNEIQAVRGLIRGRSPALDKPPVGPADGEAIHRVMAVLHPKHRDKVELQLLTGMRPGEVCSIRPCDLDRSNPVWIYRPDSHKTEHKGRERAIPIGPKAQLILSPHLASARDTERFLHVRIRRGGGSPAGGNQTAAQVYYVAVRYACFKAGVSHWHPNQLRHNAATEIRRRFGLEAAQHVLGHAKSDMTEIYAEKNLDAAVAVAAAMG